MKTIYLKRITMKDAGMFGVLIQEHLPFAVTIERPWLGNVRGISCIPADVYQCKRVDSPKFGNTFEVTDVEGRSHILFHKGNIMDDTHGCIVIGEQYEPLNGVPAVLASGKGFGEFMERLNAEDRFVLVIQDHT